MAPSMAWWGVGHGVVGGSGSLLVPSVVPAVSLGPFLEPFCIIVRAIFLSFSEP